MRCPKCGYISFDHNLVCPKCNKDISGEQKRLNLPSFMPSPPRILEPLLGETGDSHFSLGGGAVAETLRLDGMPEVSIIEPEKLDVGAVAEDAEEEFEIELDTGGTLSGDEELMLDLGPEGDSLEGLEEIEIDEELLDSKTEVGTRELDMDTAEMITQELDEGHETMSKESGEFDLELKLKEDNKD